jgi:hypothetical protein
VRAFNDLALDQLAVSFKVDFAVANGTISGQYAPCKKSSFAIELELHGASFVNLLNVRPNVGFLLTWHYQ